MTVDEIRELIQLGSDTKVAELELQRGDNRVRIRFSHPADMSGFAPTMYHTAAPSPPIGVAPSVQPASSGVAHAPEAKTQTPEPKPDPAVQLVKSPIVGTFYECPSPGTPPFVRIGETVQPGRVLCIIESMKLMNEIEAEFAGVVESKLVPNGAPVEYGEALFGVRPL